MVSFRRRHCDLSICRIQTLIDTVIDESDGSIITYISGDTSVYHKNDDTPVYQNVKYLNSQLLQVKLLLK